MGYGTELQRSTGTWWTTRVCLSAPAWLGGGPTVAVSGGMVTVVWVVVMALVVVLVHEVVVVLLLLLLMVASSSLGCLPANSVILKTNCRQPSLM